jgi:hypothetical protein
MQAIYSTDGSDIGLSSDRKHQYDMGIGLKVGYDALNLGNDIKLR